MQKQIYIISGLGADERVFQNLDFSAFSVNHIHWLPVEASETIEQYASRLHRQIKIPNPIIIGLSFGGMMAIEVAKQIRTEKVILISSAKTKDEIPLMYQLIGRLRLHRIVPTRILKSSNFITNWLFGVRSTENKQLLKQILNDTNPDFLKWAIHQIVSWKNTSVPGNCIHIHGTKDHILPIRCVNPDISVKNGGHLMILDVATEISQILHTTLNKTP